jgi:hypothetical protein
VAWNLSVVYPQPFATMLLLLGFLQMDFLSLDCVNGKSNFFNRVLVTSLVPIALAFTNGVIFLVRWFFFFGGKTSAATATPLAARRASIASQHSSAFLLLTYVVLPTCSMVQFQVCVCVFFHPSYHLPNRLPSCKHLPHYWQNKTLV